MKRAQAKPLGRTIGILQHIIGREVPPTLSELSRALGLPKPTAHRFVTALEGAGLIRKHPLTRRYEVAEALQALAFGAIRAGVSHGTCRFHLQKLANEVGERINVGVLVAHDEPHVAWVESVSPVREGAKLDVKPGLRLPLHCTSNGKLLLAEAPRRFRSQFLEAGPYRQYTRNTITSPSALRVELERISERGHSEDNEEFLDGVVCLAVPVRDEQSRVVAGLAIMTPAVRLSLEQARKYLPQLRACAGAIARELARPTLGEDGGGTT
jgi:DNA-binding IclR family transcriptional regulator